MRRFATTVIAAVAAATSLTGCGTANHGGGGGTDAAPVISSFTFQPNPIQVAAGTTVTWTNKDPTDHSIVGAGFGSPGHIGSGKTYAHTFTRPGTYRYHCGIHTYMEGTVIVR